jgi:hypothetical protein
MGYPISCIGNTNWATLLLNFLGETVDSPIEYFPVDPTISDKFCIIRVGPLVYTDDDAAVEMIFTVFDTDIYKDYQTAQESDGSTIYYYPLSLRLEALGQMHTIDKKYLGDIQAD